MHSRSQPYKKVTQEEKKEDAEEILKKQRTERMDRITSKVHAVFWVALAIVVAVYTDIIKRGLHDPHVNRMYLSSAVACFIANMIIMLYLTLWLPYVQKITIPWDIYCPNLIPAATFLSLACGILLMMSFWPLYGMLTPLIIFTLFMGVIFSAHFIPWPF